MTRMDRDTGKLMSGIDEIKASIHEILLTPRGSVPLFREFGSDLFDLIDAPQSKELLVRTKFIDAIQQWEPRVSVEKVEVIKGNGAGTLSVDVYFKEVASGQRANLRVSI